MSQCVSMMWDTSSFDYTNMMKNNQWLQSLLFLIEKAILILFFVYRLFQVLEW